MNRLDTPPLASRYVRAGVVVLALLLSACATTPPQRPSAAEGAPEPAATDEEMPASSALPAASVAAPALSAVEPQASSRERLRAVMDDASCHGDQRKLAGPFQPRHLQRVLEQRNDLFSWVAAEIHARKLPGQFVAMPILESAYQADPGNRGAVRGLWQFAAATGRRFGLHVGPQRDDRLDPIASTHAALDHLGEMWRRWGDWRLAVIGFNAGEYAVTTALRRDPRAIEEKRLPRSLPSRALIYVQRTQAVACLLLIEPALRRWLDAPSALLAAQTLPAGLRSLDDAAALLGSERAELLRLNPELARRHFPLHSDTRVLAVAGRGEKGPPALAAAARPRESDAVSMPAARIHVVAHGDSPWSIARRHRIALRDLLRWNRLHGGSVLQPGQRLRLEP